MKPKISTFILGILTCTSTILSASHVQCQDSYPANNKHNYYTRIPFDYSNRLIKLNAGIRSGQTRHEFILDSGAPTFITDSIADAYDLEYLNSETVYDVNGNAQKMDLYNIRSIELGGKQIRGIRAASNSAVANMPILKSHRSAGLLGANIMRNSIWQINYNCRDIIMTDKSENLHLPDSAHRARMKLDELGRPLVTVIIAGKYRVDCIVDVAYNGSLQLPDRFFSKPVFNDTMSYYVQEKYSSGFETKSKKMEYRFIRNISIGDMKLENVKATASGNNTIALIGNEFLEKYTIVMDFVNKSVAFLPAEEECNTACC